MSGRVQRRQAEKYADRDAQIYAEREAAYQQVAPQPQYAEPAYAPPPPRAPAPAPAAAAADDPVAQLERLGTLKAQGILTDEEFAAAKAKVLGG